MAPPPPELMEELVEEILLRFPPHEPALLVRAALVCKRWHRLVSGPWFRRRFRELHRTPPMLGFHYRGISDDGRYVGRFVPTAAFRSPHAESGSWRATAASSSDGPGNALVPTSSSRSGTPSRTRSGSCPSCSGTGREGRRRFSAPLPAPAITSIATADPSSWLFRSLTVGGHTSAPAHPMLLPGVSQSSATKPGYTKLCFALIGNALCFALVRINKALST